MNRRIVDTFRRAKRFGNGIRDASDKRSRKGKGSEAQNVAGIPEFGCKQGSDSENDACPGNHFSVSVCHAKEVETPPEIPYADPDTCG